VSDGKGNNFMKHCFLFLLIIALFLLTNCSNDAKTKGLTNLENQGKISESVGYFDLKVVCLNLASKTKVNENVCETPLSKTLEANSESIWVVLEFCNEVRRTNCIEPLPENAPPEVIQIRDKESKVISPWAKVKVRMQIEKTVNKREIKPLIVEIDEF
jgi:hypothetical protein